MGEEAHTSSVGIETSHFGETQSVKALPLGYEALDGSVDFKMLDNQSLTC